MKKIAFALLAAGLLLGVSCNKNDDAAPGFDMIYQQNFTIPAGIGVFDVHHFQLKNIPTRYQQLLEQYSKADADITGILTARAALSGIFGDANLQFVEQVSVRVYDESDPTDYVEIAYRQPTPLDPGNALPLIPSLADSKRFMTGTRFAIDVVLWLRNTTQEESDVRLDLELKATF
jgi:hypothetical protein